MVTKNWFRIEIGYESCLRETCDEPTTVQSYLLGLFEKQTLLRWALGGKTPITSHPGEEDEWVPEVLQTELDAALASVGFPDRIELQDCVPLFPGLQCPELIAKVQAAGAEDETGQPGTRCKLHGDRWVNSRSYSLGKRVGETYEPWPPSENDPPTELGFITLHWHCLPSDGLPEGP